MEAVVERENMWQALKQVERNKGAAGVDNMTVGATASLSARALAANQRGTVGREDYQPQPVRKVEIPKPGGRNAEVGHSDGARPADQQACISTKAHSLNQASLNRATAFGRTERPASGAKSPRVMCAEGRRWVVDIDLEKFFDRVNHDILMSRVARRSQRQASTALDRQLPASGNDVEGVSRRRAREGTPQGGPLSPLLSNILLDELDKELERRGHKFCRYADDCNIYVQSRDAGERVMKSITSFLERATAAEGKRGERARWRDRGSESFWATRMTWHRKPRLKVAKESVQATERKLGKSFVAGEGAT